jgi:hypothetical protein
MALLSKFDRKNVALIMPTYKKSEKMVDQVHVNIVELNFSVVYTILSFNRRDNVDAISIERLTEQK